MKVQRHLFVAIVLILSVAQWAMAAMAGSVTLIFFNSLWGKPSLFFNTVMSVGGRQQ